MELQSNQDDWLEKQIDSEKIISTLEDQLQTIKVCTPLSLLTISLGEI